MGRAAATSTLSCGRPAASSRAGSGVAGQGDVLHDITCRRVDVGFGGAQVAQDVGGEAAGGGAGLEDVEARRLAQRAPEGRELAGDGGAEDGVDVGAGLEVERGVVG